MSTAAPLAPTPAEVRDRFRRLAAEWKEQSRYLSNTAQMAMLRPYQRIIGLGWPAVPLLLDELGRPRKLGVYPLPSGPAVPLLLDELGRDPDQWFWALEAITDENPVPADAAGDVRRSAAAWVAWGKARGLLPA